MEPDTGAWLLYMYLVAIVGALLGLLYPTILARFRKGPPPRYRMFGTERPSLGGWAGYIGAGLLLSAIVVTIGFAGFIGDDENKKALEGMGIVGYSLAFGFGFGAGQLVEEPMKR